MLEWLPSTLLGLLSRKKEDDSLSEYAEYKESGSKENIRGILVGIVSLNGNWCIINSGGCNKPLSVGDKKLLKELKKCESGVIYDFEYINNGDPWGISPETYPELLGINIIK